MRERKTARCSFICFRRFLSTAMCVILWVSASSLFLHTFGRRRRFLRPWTAREAVSVDGAGGGGGWMSRGMEDEQLPISWGLVSAESLLQLNGVVAAESYMMKFKSSVEESVSKAIIPSPLSHSLSLNLLIFEMLLSSLYQWFECPNTIDPC